MSANLDALVQGIRAKRSEKLPQAQAHLEKLKAAREAVVTTRTRAAAVAANNPDLQTKLGGVRYDAALQLLETAIESADRAVKRLSRESINIGVAGKARQGKSQILQMLTGLSDKQIPTGDGGYCTGSRSVIRNSENNLARIYFKKEADLMEQIILPLCRSLSVSPCPGSVRAFLQSVLPEQPKDTIKANEWINLYELHRDLNDNPTLVNLLGSPAQDVGFDDLRKYVTKDEGDTLFQVVDHVYVETPFDSGLPKGMLVFDLPGLEDPTKGVLETMLTSVKEDSDIVFLMRKPGDMGDDWGNGDIEINKRLQGIYESDGIEPKDWLLLVMNHVRAHERIGKDGNVKTIPDNAANLASMLKKVSYRFPGFHAVECDCGSKDEVRKMVDENVEVLVQQTSRIDDLRLRQSDESYSAAMDEVRVVYRNLREASSDIVADQCGFNFKRKFTEFMSDLRDPLKKDLKDLSPELMAAIKDILVKNFSGAAQKMKDLYAAYDDKDDFPQDFPIYSKRYLTSKFGAANAPIDPIGESVRNQREALFKLCRDVLEGCCQQLNAAYFENVAAKVFENKAVSMATRDLVADATDSRGKIEAFSALLNREGHSPTLASAVAGLLSFNLTFESTILPALYGVPAFADFNPESPTLNFTDMVTDINSIQTKEERADCLYNWQKWRCEQILSDATSGTEFSPLTVISTYVSNIMQANFSSFVFSFIWGEDCTNEWERLVKSNQSVFWKDEFEAAARNSEISRAWSEALSALRTLVG